MLVIVQQHVLTQGRMYNHFMKFVIVEDSSQKVIQIVSKINDKGWAIVYKLHQKQFVHRWWILRRDKW